MGFRQESKRRFYYFSIGMFFLFFLQAFVCAQTPTPTPENTSDDTEIPKTVNQSSDSTDKAVEELIHIGDLIDVDVFGSAEYDWRGSLNPEGFLNGLNFVEEPIFALCRTPGEVAAEIARGFGKILRDPQVQVQIIDSSGRPVSLLYGAVKTPQRFRIQRSVRLNELLILSGGIMEKASGEIQIFRPANLSCKSEKTDFQKPSAAEAERPEIFISAKQNKDSQYIKIKIADLIKGDQQANPLILSGDVVTVLEAEPIYVMGGVVSPKQINANSQMTLSRAIATAGGFTKDANQKNITIFRREKNETKTIEVDFGKIKVSPEADIILQALDIVEIARTGREKRKFPPIINPGENRNEKSVNPPLRIID